MSWIQSTSFPMHFSCFLGIQDFVCKFHVFWYSCFFAVFMFFMILFFCIFHLFRYSLFHTQITITNKLVYKLFEILKNLKRAILRHCNLFDNMLFLEFLTDWLFYWRAVCIVKNSLNTKIKFKSLVKYLILYFKNFSGIVAERVNLRYFLSLGMIFSGVFTFLFGLAKYTGIHGISYFIVIQVKQVVKIQQVFTNPFWIILLFSFISNLLFWHTSCD